MRMNTDALVLKVTDTGESDRLVTLLTSEFGVIRAFANRAKKINNKMHGATQSLCYSDFSIYQSRDSYIIDYASAKEVFFGLRDDIEKLALAQYFCALAAELGPEMEPASEMLRVILNSLHLLETGRRSCTFLKAVTELKILSLAGFMPDLTVCAGCGCEPQGTVYLNCREGCISCAACGKGGDKINATVLTAMRHICANPVERIYSFALPEQDEKRLGEICEKFLKEQTRRTYKALDFYKTIIQG
ncbi:MAG: DNA repair protein RecO [Clostridia bacterium]|nr:DNA repair protein RecO [Clostridia bacterium]